jgi:hypothetical protein
MRRLFGCLTLLLALPLSAAAQVTGAESRGFVSIFAGLQGTDGASAQAGTFPIYDETGAWAVEQSFDGGGLFWFGGGFKVWNNLAIGAAYSRVTDTQDATVTVRAPHPLLFDTPRTASASQGGLKHNENVFHLQALYVAPVGERFELTVGGGPSFFTVTHDFVTDARFTENGAPFTAITVANVQVEEADATVVGFNIGAEAAFYFTDRIGAAGFFRYSAATADMETAGGASREVDCGGPSFGGGLKIRF